MMKKRFRKSLGMLLALLMLTGLFAAAPVTVNAAGGNPYHDTGYCGADADEKNVE